MEKLLIALCPCGCIQSIHEDWKSCLGEKVDFDCDHCGTHGPQTVTYATVETPLDRLQHHVTGKIERGEGVAIVGTPALPVTDNQLQQFYLDWVNNFGSTERCAEHYGITQADALAFINRGRKLHEASTLFTVVAVSTNTNSFGYKSVVVLREDGTGYKLLVQAYGTDKVPERKDKVDLREPRFYGAPEALKVITPAQAKKILAEIK